MIHHLHESVRKVFGKSVSHRVGLIDSGGVRTTHHRDSREYGIDGGKKVKGRKEQIICVNVEGCSVLIIMFLALFNCSGIL